MNKLDIIRAWKNELFRKSLNSDQQTLVPEHPISEIVLSDEEMAKVTGGATHKAPLLISIQTD